MANPPRKASSSNKQKEMATKPSSPQSKKRVSVGAQTSMKGKTATKSPVKRSRAGARKYSKYLHCGDPINPAEFGPRDKCPSRA